MATLNKNQNHGYRPQTADGTPITISYAPQGYTSSITGIHSPGKTVAPANGSPSSTDQLIDPTQQASTDSNAGNAGNGFSPAAGGLTVTPDGNSPNNFLPSAASLIVNTGATYPSNTPPSERNVTENSGVAAENAAQAASAGKSLAPQFD
jgi:hypothetical protein